MHGRVKASQRSGRWRWGVEEPKKTVVIEARWWVKDEDERCNISEKAAR
jgi:hypothetical protein